MHRSFCVVLHGLYRGAAISCENHLSTAPSPGMSIAGAASEKALQALGNPPCAPKGGLCGCLAVGQTLEQPPGDLPVGEAPRQNLLLGPPSGSLEASVPFSRSPALTCRQHSGECRRGNRMLPRGALSAQAGAAAAARGPRARRPSNLQNSSALKHGRLATPANDSYLVDSASSHMLVSKIKPCMSKYKQLYSETANGSLNQLSFI